MYVCMHVELGSHSWVLFLRYHPRCLFETGSLNGLELGD